MLCKLMTKYLCLFVCIIILALLYPAVIQCGIMVKINYELVVVFDSGIFIIVITSSWFAIYGGRNMLLSEDFIFSRAHKISELLFSFINTHMAA